MLLTLPDAAAGIEPLKVIVNEEFAGMSPVVMPVASAAAVFGDAGGQTAAPLVVAQVQVVPVKFVIVASLMTAPVTDPGPAFVTSSV